MKFALTNELDYLNRPETVRAPCCRWHGYAGFYPRYELRNRCPWAANEPTGHIDIVVTRDFADQHQKVTTQIPIARRTSLTAWLPPAVSSLEACQTPAH